MLRLNLPTGLFFLISAITAVVASVSTVVITAPAAAPTNSPTYTDDGRFRAAILDTHNLFRKAHNATVLDWNGTLAKFGAHWTNACQFTHSHGPYGENLAKGYPNASAAVQGWGDERAKYDFAKAKFSDATGHFTQLVWKDTKTVGCGRKQCGSSTSPSWYVVCEYYPRGNVVGYFTQNVQEQIKSPSKSSALRVEGFGSTVIVVVVSMLVFAIFLS
ncbi:MAG: hypothetical protein M1840_001039 [Geoglossum simile]|nr:MAG: hypothetical protein M1840_001039 [Geoglossum simile]